MADAPRLTLSELIMTGKVSFFALMRHADVARALRDERFSSDARANWEGAKYIDESFYETELGRVMGHWMLFMDPPDHSRIRSLVNKAFTARSVERLRPRMQQLTDELLDAAAPRGEMEVMADLAFRLPIRVICELLGVPGEVEVFREASRDLATVLDVGPTPDDVIAKAVPLIERIRALIAERRKHPGDDLVTRLTEARDAEERLSEEGLLGTILLVLGAGFETTMNLIGNGVYTLLRNPDELARLRTDPSLVASAVEEILRYEPPVMATVRTALTEVEIGGNEVRPGQQGILMLAVANKDADVFEQPERFDVSRSPNPHLTFGGGHHFCPGAALARLEGQVALDRLLRRFPDLQLRAEPEWRQTVTLHGLKELWIDL